MAQYFYLFIYRSGVFNRRLSDMELALETVVF